MIPRLHIIFAAQGPHLQAFDCVITAIMNRHVPSQVPATQGKPDLNEYWVHQEDISLEVLDMELRNYAGQDASYSLQGDYVTIKSSPVGSAVGINEK